MKKLSIQFTNWKFLRQTLESLNFGPSFITWISTFYSDISSCVMSNGFTTPLFKLSRGVHQGDPLSSYLFTLALEVSAINIRNDRTIKGIVVDDEELKLIIFADDLTAFLADSKSFYHLLVVLGRFGEFSGLEVNKQKTEVLNLGPSTITAEEQGDEEVISS